MLMPLFRVSSPASKLNTNRLARRAAGCRQYLLKPYVLTELKTAA